MSCYKEGTSPKERLWVGTRGNSINVDDMHEVHIKNARKTIEDGRTTFKISGYKDLWLNIFKEELYYRTFKDSRKFIVGETYYKGSETVYVIANNFRDLEYPIIGIHTDEYGEESIETYTRYGLLIDGRDSTKIGDKPTVIDWSIKPIVISTAGRVVKVTEDGGKYNFSGVCIESAVDKEDIGDYSSSWNKEGFKLK